MTKTLNQIIFFFHHQNQNIFFSNIGNQNIFLEKKHNPPFKLNGRSLTDPPSRVHSQLCENIPKESCTLMEEERRGSMVEDITHHMTQYSVDEVVLIGLKKNLTKERKCQVPCSFGQ